MSEFLLYQRNILYMLQGKPLPAQLFGALKLLDFGGCLHFALECLDKLALFALK